MLIFDKFREMGDKFCLLIKVIVFDSSYTETFFVWQAENWQGPDWRGYEADNQVRTGNFFLTDLRFYRYIIKISVIFTYSHCKFKSVQQHGGSRGIWQAVFRLLDIAFILFF